MLKRIDQLRDKAPDPAKRSKSYGSMDASTAIEAYMRRTITMKLLQGGAEAADQCGRTASILETAPP